MVNLRVMEDRLEYFDRKLIDLEEELAVNRDLTKTEIKEIEVDIKYYEKKYLALEKKYKKAGGKGLGKVDDSLLLD